MKNISTNNNLYSLTHPQKRVWYTEKIHPNTPVHNIGGTARFKGLIDFEILQKALNHFVKTNEGLNLRMVEEDGDVRQYVQDFEEDKIDLAKWREYSEQEEKDEGKFDKYTSFSKFVGKTQYYNDFLEKPNYLRSFYEQDSRK